jgi:23S rRNA (guanosine2251-2'-O)-methyltransferase
MEKRPKFTVARRNETDPDLIFGTRAVLEALHAGREIEDLLIQRDLNNDLIRELKAAAAAIDLPYQKVPAEKLNRITKKNHQGVVCFLSPIRYAPVQEILASAFEQGKLPLLLVLDRITDVRNFGAIARTAECLGADAIVVPTRGSARINADAMKTSAGALNFIPVCREPNLKDTLRFLKDSGLQIVACTEKAEKNLAEHDLTGPIALLMGSEEDGISPEYLKFADTKALIPMQGQVASLNVSVAAAICLYEVVRQRGKE